MKSEKREALEQVHEAFHLVRDDCMMALERAQDLLADAVVTEYWDQTKYEELRRLWSKLVFYSTKSMQVCREWADEARDQVRQ